MNEPISNSDVFTAQQNKFSSLNWLASISLCLTVILGFGNSTAQATPCFDNAQSAYNYLLAQETAQTQARDQALVNINHASEGELASLHGIGSSKAQAIILYREMFGDFKTVDELEKVKGIGPKTLEKNRVRLQIRN
ncbi:ComEA family DNA-binding protein [Psychrobacter sp. 72-O-c]|uniref:ComEA family DNA-binding protein n=1 Tax=Psychrobacter sp. 72-O-c TaxID=2774125 RepID=UPI00191ADA86|nr:ComEA family DNA-binding protein [Psychrobacter sp. 72-O-c]